MHRLQVAKPILLCKSRSANLSSNVPAVVSRSWTRNAQQKFRNWRREQIADRTFATNTSRWFFRSAEVAADGGRIPSKIGFNRRSGFGRKRCGTKKETLSRRFHPSQWDLVQWMSDLQKDLQEAMLSGRIQDVTRLAKVVAHEGAAVEDVDCGRVCSRGRELSRVFVRRVFVWGAKESVLERLHLLGLSDVGVAGPWCLRTRNHWFHQGSLSQARGQLCWPAHEHSATQEWRRTNPVEFLRPEFTSKAETSTRPNGSGAEFSVESPPSEFHNQSQSFSPSRQRSLVEALRVRHSKLRPIRAATEVESCMKCSGSGTTG